MTARNAFILWFVTALSVVGFIAGFNVVVDPFGYFGTNKIGYYFSSEREFKYGIIKSYDYNAIILGDSRIAFTDPTFIKRPEFTFVNGGIGGATVAEQVVLLSATRLDRLKLAILGMNYQDLASEENCSEEVAAPPSGPWEPLRFAASWTQLAYGIDALAARTTGRSPRYHADGTRSSISKQIRDMGLDEKSSRYWRKVAREITPEPPAEPRFELAPRCRELLRHARAFADRYGFALAIVFLPRNSDMLAHMNLDRPKSRENIGKFLDTVKEVIPHVVDLSSSTFSDSQNFWLDDSTHFKPVIGAEIVEEVINRSVGAQASK
jgi:hypothetical protein